MRGSMQHATITAQMQHFLQSGSPGSPIRAADAGWALPLYDAPSSAVAGCAGWHPPCQAAAKAALVLLASANEACVRQLTSTPSPAPAAPGPRLPCQTPWQPHWPWSGGLCGAAQTCSGCDAAWPACCTPAESPWAGVPACLGSARELSKRVQGRISSCWESRYGCSCCTSCCGRLSSARAACAVRKRCCRGAPLNAARCLLPYQPACAGPRSQLVRDLAGCLR